jgi:hypothetical protein
MLDEQLIADLKTKHRGELRYVEGKAAVLVFRMPNRDEYQRFQDKVAADSPGMFRHLKELALCALVHPRGEDLNACLDLEPALMNDEIGPMLHEMAGVGRERQKGKL